MPSYTCKEIHTSLEARGYLEQVQYVFPVTRHLRFVANSFVLWHENLSCVGSTRRFVLWQGFRRWGEMLLFGEGQQRKSSMFTVGAEAFAAPQQRCCPLVRLPSSLRCSRASVCGPRSTSLRKKHDEMPRGYRGSPAGAPPVPWRRG